ncbi:unnamed protein product [Medioppia subpectinata]|uniref:RNA helicase n=1 Tax=Medioppia subpectinata TaxID=1979941 RepID=A0A7R9PTA8_9ACAR|nr:unnamed protein product [Medioppia subpectinata]CAG2099930.1 unnamed protein product [Medioppia subpectinata]
MYANTLSNEDAQALREECKMKIQGNDIPLPVADFVSLGFPTQVIDKFAQMKFTVPTPIQAQGWPMALSGRDMVGIADTGSGKTLSFVLPALIHAKAQPRLREGANIVPQKKALSKGVEILVATPDRMLDMGFEPQLNDIIPKTHKNRQTLMWSATWPKEVRQLANNYASRDYIQVTIGDGELAVNKKIKQAVEVVSCHDKQAKLLFLLQDKKQDRCIIFSNMKSTCDKLEYTLQDKGFNAVAIHGNKSQAARDNMLQQEDLTLKMLKWEELLEDLLLRGFRLQCFHPKKILEMPGNLYNS